MQALYLLALLPIAETTADPNSYGFRPERSTADAIEQCFCTLANRHSAQWVLEGVTRKIPLYAVRDLVAELSLRERVMVMIAGSTGPRRSELFALRWSDVNFFTMEIAVTRSCVRNHFGDTKTEASRKPVPLHGSVCGVLAEWRAASPFNGDADFLFPSLRMNGTQPLMPDMVLKKAIRPALTRAGITGKVILAGTAWQPTSAAWEWMSRLPKSCSGTPIHAPRWTSTRKPFPQTSGVRVRGRLRCCWHEFGTV